jgi:pimeloyl-ACP methyl ester carboxylesterase
VILVWVLCGSARAEVHELAFESGGVTLEALLHTPESGSANTLVVYLHGNPGRPLEPESWLVDELLEQGIAVFRFNYRGLWGNAGDFNLANGIEDMRSALSFLTTQEAVGEVGVSPERIVLFGYSFGTAVALSGAYDDDRVAAIAALAPCDHGYFGAEFADPESQLRDFLDTVTEALFGENGPIQQDAAIFTSDLVDNSDDYRFPRRAAGLRDKQLLFFVGLDDEVCFAEDHFFPLYRALESASHPATDVDVLAMDHGMRPVGREAIASRLAEWIVDSGREDFASMTTSDERLNEFAVSYTAAWNSGDPGEVARHYAEGGSLAINGGEPAVGREELAEVAESFMTGFPDMVLTFDGLTFEEGRVQFHWTFRGTNTGPGGTGQRVDFGGFESWRINDEGLVADSLGNFDQEEYERQLESGVEAE